MEQNHTITLETFEFLNRRWPLKAVTKALLYLNGISTTGLAEDSGVARPILYSTLNGHRKNPRAMAAVSQRLGIPVRELFDGHH